MTRDGVERHQEAYHNLSDLIEEADELLHAGVHNERKLRQAYAEAEDLLFDLDRIEYELIHQIERAENGNESTGVEQS